MINEYLDNVFGNHEGYVAVAYKDQGNSWQETEFAWPQDRRKLIGWAKIHRDANLFVCPALRGTPSRKKNDGLWLQWLWADVDWDKVPDNKLNLVEKRIGQLATMVVESGSVGKGDRKNVHVYVRLKAPLSSDQFNFDNTWLRNFLYADNKQADNSLLRLPGSKNWKTKAGTPVILTERGHGREIGRAAYTGTQAYKDTKVIDVARGDASWQVVDTKDVKSRHRRMAKMSEDEAQGRYGARWRAVWAVTGDLHKAGYSDDVIHTLMDAFPPAEAKNLDEHGGYDVHKDVARRLAYDRSDEGGDDVPPDGGVVTAEDVAMDDDGEAAVVLTADEDRADAVARLAEKYSIGKEARRLAEEWDEAARYEPMPEHLSWDLESALQMPPEPDPMLIEDMWSARGNVILTAQYKTGKTAFIMGGIVPAICDGEDFLGKFKTFVGDGGARLGHWNLEMDSQYLLDQYLRPVKIKNPRNLHVANWRGKRINILMPKGKAEAIDWLRSREIKVWTVDSWAEIARMAGINPNDAGEVAEVLGAIDEIKDAAGVDAFLALAHTGRAKAEEGEERAMGSAYLDGWTDHRWVMTKQGDVRYLAAEGRGPKLSATSLVFDSATMRTTLGDVSKADMAEASSEETVLSVVTAHPGIHQGQLVKLVRERGVKAGNASILEAVEVLKQAERIHSKRGRAEGQKGGRQTNLFYPGKRKAMARGEIELEDM